LKQKLLQMANPQRIALDMIPPFISDSYSGTYNAL